MYAKLERKICKKCKVEKSLDSFRLRHKKGRKPSYESYCIQCERNERRQQYRDNKPYWKHYDFIRNCKKFGLTVEQYKQMVKDQDNRCAICAQNETATRGGVVKNLAIDHCHKTGKNRHLLCAKCNTAIGLLNEDISLFDSAIRYLSKFKS